MRKEFEENEESENKSENNLETQDEIDDETFQKILEKEFIEREKRITAALFADDDVEDIKFTKEELDNSYQEFLRRIEREKREGEEGKYGILRGTGPGCGCNSQERDCFG